MATTSIRRSEPVLRRLWAPDPAGLLELWQHEGPRTLRIFRVFADAHLSYRPAAGARSIGELLQHVISGYATTRHWLLFDAGGRPPDAAPPGNTAEASRLLAAAQQDLFASLEVMPAANFLVEIAPFGVRETRAVMALGMLKHEIHHRGELYALARICGLRPPGLYDPIRE